MPEIGSMELEGRYHLLRPKYERLASNLERVLHQCLSKASVEYISILTRVKSYHSFLEKTSRKNYSSPFEQTEDLCGLRVICYYSSDVPKIGEVIASVLMVKGSIDKTASLEPDRFGYRSAHFIVSPQTSWLSEPSYHDLEGLAAEVQVRTVLMHAWAEIEHKLAYKKQEHVPPEFRRRFSRLSALLELSDDEFDILRHQREEYQKRLSESTGRLIAASNSLNLDSLQAFLDALFPDRTKNELETRDLLDELIECDLTFEAISRYYDQVRQDLSLIEKEIFLDRYPASRWAQVGALRAILELADEDYWKARQAYMTSHTIDVLSSFRRRTSASDAVS